MKDITTRSETYQFKILEICVDFNPASNMNLKEWSNSESLHPPTEHSEEFIELNDESQKLFLSALRSELSAHQQKVIDLKLSGSTQDEIAKTIGVCQSSVTKCFNGNVQYLKGKQGNEKQYGGIVRKGMLNILKSQEMKDILKRMRDLE